jgi:uncharacterized protein (DUF608 family)
LTGEDGASHYLTPATEALLARDPAERRARLDPSIVDVSHGEGVPIGTLGSGHSVFGRNGFSRVAFAGAPNMGPDFESPRFPADFGFFLSEGDVSYALQERPPVWRHRAARERVVPMERVLAYAELPKAHFRFEHEALELDLVMSCFSPVIAHDIETSSIPVQVFDVVVQNRSTRARSLELQLAHAEALFVSLGTAWHGSPGGHVVFAADGGATDSNGVFFSIELEPGARQAVRFFIAWHFSEFKTPSPAATVAYRRRYAARFRNAAATADLARERADEWSRAIDAWRASFDVPPEMKRLWFSSLSSVITSTMLADDCFFAIEAPHDWVNTMDVAVYANWVYLVNWPELERIDLDQFLSIIPTEGDDAGFVVHSIWTDASHYAEEPTFLTRFWRSHLWFNDVEWLKKGSGAALAAAKYAHRYDSFENLLTSKKGNQSYDEWMMPGASAYVNVAWLYALHALEGIERTLGSAFLLGDKSVRDLLPLVRSSLLLNLWNERGDGYFRCFHRTPGAADTSVEETVFTDQLFGAWVLLLDETAGRVLPRENIATALRTVYENNLLDDPEGDFRGWVNGMLPGRRPDMTSGYHARTCWLGAQLDLASLLGAVGDEARSLDVFRSIEKSLLNNHLCVGEWNRSIDSEGHAVVLDEWGKDTPRFPPYPRYTSCWEYLIRMLGLTLDAEFIYLRPFRSLRFELRNVRLAGTSLSVRVEPHWSHAIVDGVEVAGAVKLRRGVSSHIVEFGARRDASNS